MISAVNRGSQAIKNFKQKNNNSILFYACPVSAVGSASILGTCRVRKFTGSYLGAPLAHVVECGTLDSMVACLNLTRGVVLCP